MKLQARVVDGEMQIRDLDTDNGDIVAIVPLTGDEEYDSEVRVPFADAICAVPQMRHALEAIANDINDILADDDGGSCSDDQLGAFRDVAYEAIAEVKFIPSVNATHELILACSKMLEKFEYDVRPGEAGWDAIVESVEALVKAGIDQTERLQRLGLKPSDNPREEDLH